MADIRAVRVGDFITSVCQNVPPGSVKLGSPTSFVNNRPQVRLFDESLPGPGTVLTGSSTTFVDNKPSTRVLDLVTCGRIIVGSFDTFIS
jgi:uncharacterized Zn-binding protein involved in type VI secretion